MQLLLNPKSDRKPISQSFSDSEATVEAGQISVRFKPVKEFECYDPTKGYCCVWTLKTAGQVVCIDIETAGTAFVTAYVQSVTVRPDQQLTDASTDGCHVQGGEMIDPKWWGKHEISQWGEFVDVMSVANWSNWLPFQLGRPFVSPVGTGTPDTDEKKQASSDETRWHVYHPYKQLIAPSVKHKSSSNKWPIKFTRLLPITPKVEEQYTHAVCIHLQPFVDVPDGICLRRIALYGRPMPLPS